MSMGSSPYLQFSKSSHSERDKIKVDSSFGDDLRKEYGTWLLRVILQICNLIPYELQRPPPNTSIDTFNEKTSPSKILTLALHTSGAFLPGGNSLLSSLQPRHLRPSKSTLTLISPFTVCQDPSHPLLRSSLPSCKFDFSSLNFPTAPSVSLFYDFITFRNTLASSLNSQLAPPPLF